MKMLLLPNTLNQLNHELRTSLTTILGTVMLLDKEVLISNQKLYLQELKKYAQDLLSFVDRLPSLAQEINVTQGASCEVNTTSINAHLFKVLLVEDTPIIQIVHKRMLENLGYQVELVSSAEKALYKITTTIYDVILMDIGLPGMSGIDAAIEIRRQEQHGQNVPIIALTAFSNKEMYQDCLNAGINDVVTKPISQEDLQRLVAYYTNKQMTVSI
ncbi:MAG: response regulator [Candidatus Rickettsiella isopodorum]